MKHILSLDIGTTSTRAIIFDTNLRNIAQVSHKLNSYANDIGDVEQDAQELWEKTRDAAKQVIKKSRVKTKDVACIGITNQRETVISWDAANGKPLHRAIVWQDRRTSSRCKALEKKRALARRIRAKTGLVIDPSFSATKMEWLNNKLKSKKKRLLFGTVDAWILWNLTGGKSYATEPSNASRTMLMNLKNQKWDEELLKLFKIQERQLPRIQDSDTEFGYTDKKIFDAKIPITGILGDQQAALFSHGPLRDSMLAVTYGTGIFTLKSIGQIPRPATSGILTTLAWKRAGRPAEYAYETSALTGGAMLEWIKEKMHLVETMKEFDRLASTVKTTGGVTIVPAFSGLAAPDWDPAARGLIIGLNRSTERAHICRAAIEAIACQTERMAALLEEQTGTKNKAWHVSGGLTRSEPLMQSQSDISRVKVRVAAECEATAVGAAMMAGLGAELWPAWRDIAAKQNFRKTYTPKRPNRGKLFLKQYERALERARGWATQ
ncbi:glycerol kinase GlpK [Candidatus Uhrbacteria bacterium]|nr:glycerol kinase GlpK [Candidatus Uhrbacteria bacterium]